MIRHTRERRCAVCGGHPDLPRHRGQRCYGFRSDDGRYEHCSREEYAGGLEIHGASSTYCHRLDGPCRCGAEHGAAREPMDRAAVMAAIPSAAERSEIAQRIWREARPAAGTIVERYLRARAITIPPPASLRFAMLWHAPSRRELPAMVARVDNVRGELVAVHRTYLRPDGAARVDKLMIGPVRAAATRLAPTRRKLGLTEGIETALSVMTAIPELSVWAALSTSGLRTIELPPPRAAAEVVIFADADPDGLAAAEDAAERLGRAGRRVRIARPPEGFADFNDVLRGVG